VTTASTPAGSFLAGVPQHGDTLGKPTAPATLVVFEDPQCPFCRDWSLGALPTVVDRFVKTGKVKLVWRGIDIIGPNSLPGLRAAYAAANQNRLWNFIDALYRRQGSENSGWITDALLKDAAKDAGVNATAMLAASPSRNVTAALRSSATEATQDNVQGTPTFILVKPPAVAQQVQVTSLDPAPFSDSLSAALR
jgi:protein-disulfide isomerase